MIERLRAAWAALRGGLVLSGHGWVVVYVTPLNTSATRWDGLTIEDAAKLLYQGGDALVDRIYGHTTIH
ncbi:hypothetical protein [Luteibacter yeojuensis]|uniref:Uncharacterized protein n=1 Tax=Luteibacter yeojuensis TaxID=345309 RepID=A0A7X5TPD5_9GAMM|nr:hypothetical protein [Luteibacter yeojuensis]NID14372.1 hypothetical protein [Luteibacter yeojuensis]